MLSSEKGLVSVVIPFFNAAEWIGETLESVLAQTYKHFEIILVDDGSQDDSLKVISRYRRPSLKVVEQENSGASAARNRGLSIARGEFIQFLDADDLLSPNKLEVQVMRLRNESAKSIASCAWTRFTGPIEHAQLDCRKRGEWRDMCPLDWLVKAWGSGAMMPIHGWLVPRAVIADVGDWVESLSTGDDGEYFTRVALKSDRIAFCPETWVYYRSQLKRSLSQRKDLVSLTSVFNVVERSTDALLAVESSPRTRHAAANAFQRVAYEAYPIDVELAEVAAARASALGGADLTPGGGRFFRALVSFTGWRRAIAFQTSYRKWRYGSKE